MAYDIDFVEKAVIGSHIKKFLLYPEFWKDPTNKIPNSLVWKSCKFEAINKNVVSVNRGIYCFVVKPEILNLFETSYLFYVGKTNRTLDIRFGDYLRDQAGKGKPRPKVYEMLIKYKDYLHFYYADLPNKKSVDNCEERLLNLLVPHVNTDIPKAKIKPELKYIYES